MATETMYTSEQFTSSNTKGGGSRGGPKRWTGAGPRPARHIPWPEIFKHHISVVEGHLKMLDMVRKHTVPETGNWRTILPMVDRAQEMLRMAKDISRSFVPPADTREYVPIGSSSASMYPGYSPADHEYGKAAQEFGEQWSQAKINGVEFRPKPDGPQYEFTSSLRKKARVGETVSGPGFGSGSGSDKDSKSNEVSGKESGKEEQSKSEVDKKPSDSPFFIVDTKPTPINLLNMLPKPEKRTLEEQPPSESHEKKVKKSKSKHNGELPAAPAKRIEFEDITSEVDARMQEKEEKRQRKEKKRKRDSEVSAAAIEPAAEAEAEKAEKPRKKKNKKNKISDDEKLDGLIEVTAKKRQAECGEENGNGEGKKKKKKLKKSKGESVDV